MKKICVALLVMLLGYNVYAQSTITDKRANQPIEYLFYVGDTIKFYPLNPDYIGEYSNGYTCFYDIQCIESGIKPKYRFAANKKKLTPNTEIENSFFYVKSLCSYDFKKENNLFFAAILERLDDHVQICFVIPADLKKESKNSILNSWVVTQKSKGPFSQIEKSGIVIPFIKKDFIDKMSSLKGETLVFRNLYNKMYEDYYMLRLANGETKANRFSDYKQNGYVPTGTELIVDKFSFVPCGSDLLYSQPCITITNSTDAHQYRIPVTHFAGNCDILYTIRGKIENLIERHFLEKEPYVARLKANGPKMDSLIGKIYYFDTNNYYFKEGRSNSPYLDEWVALLDNQRIKYNINNGFYKCVGFDYFHGRRSSYNFYDYYAIFEDSIGQRFIFPTSFTIKVSGMFSTDLTFKDVFELKEAKEAKERKEELDKKEKERLIKQYGLSVWYAIASGKCSEARFKELQKKYGKKKADYMASGMIDVGWTFSEVMESVGKEYFECVHTHKNRYAYWEVYQYKKYTPSYVTFRNNVVVGISDYMSTDY